MRIKKILGTVGLVGNILNNKSISKKDAYSCDYINKLMSNVYPVGSIYLSVNDINPSIIFGGTWEQIKDRFLLGCGDTYTNGTLGGETNHTLTIEELPSHRHDLNGCWGAGNGLNTATLNNADSAGGSGNAGYLPIQETGGNQPHNNMPPYLTVYMWKRIN